MNEQEWLACDDPVKMIHFLFEGSRRLLDRTVAYPISDRKLRLFACAACSAFPVPNEMDAVEVAERYADGLATIEQLL